MNAFVCESQPNRGGLENKQQQPERAILKPLSLQRGTPILTCESDGYAVSPSFLRQVDAHIQQVLEHAAKARG